MADVQEVKLPLESFETFKAIFFSKSELSEAGADLKAEKGGGWKGAVGAQLALGKTSSIKDPAFLEDLKGRLARHGLDSELTRFSGGYVTQEDGSLQLDLGVRFQHPNLLYRIFMEEHVVVPIRLKCRRDEEGVTLTAEQPFEKTVGCVGCLVTVVAFAAFIVPGIVVLYVTGLTKAARRNARAAVFEGLQDRLVQART